VQPSNVVLVAVIPLVAWRLYSRMRRLVGRQRSRAWRHWTAALVFPLLAALVAVGAASSARAEEALAAGLAIGIALALWGLRLTRFERTPEGWFYTPNAHIGIAISVLFVARIAWRLMEAGPAFSRGAAPHLTRSPLTLLVFGVVAGYYSAYAAGVLRWRHSRPQAPGPGQGGA